MVVEAWGLELSLGATNGARRQGGGVGQQGNQDGTNGGRRQGEDVGQQGHRNLK